MNASSLLANDAFWSALGVVIALVMCTCHFLSDMAGSRQQERKNAAQAESLLKAELVLRGEFDEWLADELLRLQIDCAASPGDEDRSARLAAVEIAKQENTARIVALHQGNAKPDPGATEAVKGRWQFLRTGTRVEAVEAVSRSDNGHSPSPAPKQLRMAVPPPGKDNKDKSDSDGDFLTSAAVAAATNSTLLGYAVGGSLVGAALGDALVPDKPRSAYDGDSCSDFGSSDSGSDFGSGGDC